MMRGCTLDKTYSMVLAGSGSGAHIIFAGCWSISGPHFSSYVHRKFAIPISGRSPERFLNHVLSWGHPMASPPAKSAKYHHDPCFMDQMLVFHPLQSHVVCDRGEVVPILVHAFCHPIAEAIVVPRFVFTDIFPSVSPVINRMSNVGCHKVHVDEVFAFILFKFDEVVGSLIPLRVDSLQKFEFTTISPVVSYGFVFPCEVIRFEGLI